jgi:hypothetical protein
MSVEQKLKYEKKLKVFNQILEQQKGSKIKYTVFINPM